MNYFEAEIARCNRRIKRIEDDPDPAMFKSNKMLYELERDLYAHRLNAWQEGKPFAAGVTWSLLQSMGFEDLELTTAADRSQLASQHFDIVRRAGYKDDACDRTVVCIAMCMEKELPPPAFLSISNVACDPIMLSYNALGRAFNVPMFNVDVALERNNESLKYIVDQMGEMIEYAEKIPGIKYDESKLAALQEADKVAHAYATKVYELRKRVPCPIAGKDAFRLPRPPSRYHNQQKALDYWRVWYEEMGERAEQGRGAVEDEKLRILWAVSGPFYTDPFSLLERRGVSVPWFHYDMATRWMAGKYGGYGDETEYSRKLSPLEEEARMCNYLTWASVGQRWVDDLLMVCRDLKIDAIIHFSQVGCTAVTSLGRLVEDAAEKQLGIPTMHLEGRQLDPSAFDQATVYAKLNDFVDLCLLKKDSA